MGEGSDGKGEGWGGGEGGREEEGKRKGGKRRLSSHAFCFSNMAALILSVAVSPKLAYSVCHFDK